MLNKIMDIFHNKEEEKQKEKETMEAREFDEVREDVAVVIKEEKEMRNETEEEKSRKKTVNTEEVVLLKLNEEGIYEVASNIYPNFEALQEDAESLIANGNLASGNYKVALLYWVMEIEIPEVKPKIRIG